MPKQKTRPYILVYWAYVSEGIYSLEFIAGENYVALRVLSQIGDMRAESAEGNAKAPVVIGVLLYSDDPQNWRWEHFYSPEGISEADEMRIKRQLKVGVLKLI